MQTFITTDTDDIIGDKTGQQTYIKTEQCEQIHKLGHIKADEFNEFVYTAIADKIEAEADK